MLLSVVGALAFLSFLFWLQWARIRKLPVQFDLQPNCLITHSPLLLLNGPQSLFYFGRYWNAIPLALQEHGYETYVWQSRTRKTKQRLQELEHFLKVAEQQNMQFHLIADSSNLSLLETLARNSHSAVASLNLVHKEGVEIKHRSQELKPSATAIVEWPLATQALSTTQRVLNWAHNRWVGPKKSTDLALLSTSPFKNWLEIAISLAEKEMKCSHESHGNYTVDATHP